MFYILKYLKKKNEYVVCEQKVWCCIPIAYIRLMYLMSTSLSRVHPKRTQKIITQYQGLYCV